MLHLVFEEIFKRKIWKIQKHLLPLLSISRMTSKLLGLVQKHSAAQCLWVSFHLCHLEEMLSMCLDMRGILSKCVHPPISTSVNSWGREDSVEFNQSTGGLVQGWAHSIAQSTNQITLLAWQSPGHTDISHTQTHIHRHVCTCTHTHTPTHLLK